MEGIKNEEGKTFLPKSSYDPLEPVNGAVYIADEEFEQMKTTQSSPNSDSPKADNQPQTGDTPSSDTNPTQGKPADTIDYDSIVKEKTGGKYEKWDDLAKVLEAPTQQPLDLDESAKAIIENISKGNYGEVTTFLMQKQLLQNLDKMTPEDVVKYKMQIENPDFTDEDVEDEYQQRYGVGVDQEDVDEKEFKKLQRRAERKLENDAKAARETLSKLNADLKLPSFSTPSTEASVDPEVEKTIEDINKLSEAFSKGVEKDIRQFAKIDLSIQDKDVQFSHDYAIDDLERADLESKAGDYFGYMQSRYYKDGQYDTQKFLNDVFLIENFHKILKSAVTRAINLGKIDVAKGVANVTDQRTPSTTNFADDRRRGAEEFAYS